MLLALVAMMMPIGAWAYYEPQSVQINIGTSGVATLYYGAHNLVIPEGVSASIITHVEVNEDGIVTVTEDDVTVTVDESVIIPAGCAVILRGTPGEYDFGIHEGELNVLAPSDDNLLRGSDELTTDTEEGYLYFTLDSENGENSASLKDWIYVGNKVDNEAHKAYLALPEGYCLELAAMLGALENPHLQHTHGGCEICGQVTEVSWGASADALTSYGTLTEAVAAAGEEDSNIGYIKLLADVESEIAISVNGGNFTLDLNGHTISSVKHTLDIQYESNVTIVDNEANEGKVISTGNGCLAVSVAESATVTINGGSYINSSYMPVYIGEGCSATIMDGIFEYTSYGAIDNYGNLVVEGGTFTYKGDGESSPTIFYYGGSIDLSKYPTDAINSIGVINDSGEDITPGAETILLPEGYCFLDSDGTPVTILEYSLSYCIGEEPKKYTITFAANGGGGEMEGSGIYEGNYTLPECTFTAPEGKMFKAWQIGEKECQPYETVTIMDNTTITALWTEYVPQIVIKMHDSYGDGWQNNAIVVNKNGEEIGTATIIEVGRDGIVRYDYDNSAVYTFYWQSGENSEECSFEIFIDDEEVFAAVRDVEENTFDCESYGDGELIHTINGEPIVVESLTIVDGEHESFYVEENLENVDITYTRTLPNLKWNALYVPFEIPVSALTDKYDVAYINDIRSYDENEDGALDRMTMEIIKLSSGTLHANHPYLIRAKNEEAKNMNLVLTDATLRQTEENSFTCSSMYMDFTVTGSYNSLSAEKLKGKYAISEDGAWQLLNEGTTLKPFRLYMEMTDRDGSPVKVESAALSRIRISVQGEEDGATGIEMVDTPQHETDGAFFDLSGRKVKAPVKGGIYIRNGKKILVK